MFIQPQRQLLEHLLKHQVIMVVTSNRAPDSIHFID
jgi:predicted ATPase